MRASRERLALKGEEVTRLVALTYSPEPLLTLSIEGIPSMSAARDTRPSKPDIWESQK